MIISDSGSSYEQLEEGLHPAVSILIAGGCTQRTPLRMKMVLIRFKRK